jgi:two-component system cell cycle sensor histidine kinase PleC
MRIVSQRAQDKDLTLQASIAPDISFHGDRRSLKQIALNLLSNAVKFTPEGGRVTVRGRAANGIISIAVVDTGIGIAKDALERLGRPFEQVDSQLTRRHEGSGLGLAIAKSLVQLHGGTMRIRSAVGKGTTVLVRLPSNPTFRPNADTTQSPPAGRRGARKDERQGSLPGFDA